MSDKANPTKPQDNKDAMKEAQQQYENLKGQLKQATKAAHDSIAPALQTARERLQEAETQLAAASDMRQQLEPHKQNLMILEDYERMTLLERLYTQAKVFALSEIEVWERNLKHLNDVPQDGTMADYTDPTVSELVLPASDPNYLLQRTLLDVAMLAYHWHRNRMAIDIVLRAAGKELRTFKPNEQGELHLAEQARILREAAATNMELAMLLGSLGASFEETYALFEWGQSSAETLSQLPPAVRKERLEDTDWAKLNGGLVALLDVPARVAQQPLLVKLFSEAD